MCSGQVTYLRALDESNGEKFLLCDLVGQLGAADGRVGGENTVASSWNVHFRVTIRQFGSVWDQRLVTSEAPTRHVSPVLFPRTRPATDPTQNLNSGSFSRFQYTREKKTPQRCQQSLKLPGKQAEVTQTTCSTCGATISSTSASTSKHPALPQPLHRRQMDNLRLAVHAGHGASITAERTRRFVLTRTDARRHGVRMKFPLQAFK